MCLGVYFLKCYVHISKEESPRGSLFFSGLLLLLLSLSDLLCIAPLQQVAVGGDFLFQPCLDIHQHLVFAVLALHVISQLSQLFLHASDHVLDLS